MRPFRVAQPRGIRRSSGWQSRRRRRGVNDRNQLIDERRRFLMVGIAQRPSSSGSPRRPGPPHRRILARTSPRRAWISRHAPARVRAPRGRSCLRSYAVTGPGDPIPREGTRVAVNTTAAATAAEYSPSRIFHRLLLLPASCRHCAGRRPFAGGLICIAISRRPSARTYYRPMRMPPLSLGLSGWKFQRNC